MTPSDRHFVDADWLAEHLDDVVLLDATVQRNDDEPRYGDGRPLFEAGHVPGARFADLFAVFSDPGSSIPFARPTRTQIVSAARAVGIGPHATVVTYDQSGGAWAARLWWVLRSWGHQDVRVLDGGLAAWEASGRHLEVGPGRPTVSDESLFTPTDVPDVIADIDETARAAAGDGGAPVICALRAADFAGDPAIPGTGSIPGSINIPYPDTLDPDGRHDPTATRQLIEAAGLNPAQSPILYCGGGINAAGLALALAEHGIESARVFDGSLAEWRADDTRPLTTSPWLGDDS
ncbi:rhodanese-like domain-containing protein [Gordonia sp. ABSL11-1]|uniref:sulfurtransferase n=1 Tax=Gordonia sp. ABSL11-1 TaxID=3053924 RepID=UPI002572DAF1|nr:rhodanese-like domain-containing protein [Gordonia sp. ABSL11-1]MDL9948643.1 rhodanese-like domain-containing protein [Gordonia sp. ABSL11-1]